MNVCGQEFSEGIIERIHQMVQSSAGVTRGSLARAVCEWLDWRHYDGRLKEINSRVALTKLEQRGVIELPKAKEVNFKRPNTNDCDESRVFAEVESRVFAA